MSRSEENVRLSVGEAELTVDPGHGCRISSLRIGGAELLRQGERYGCFPMVPWCGRTGNGEFRNGDVLHRLPLNSPPHAIHGTGRDTSWQPASTAAELAEGRAAFYYDLADPWPYRGRVTQTFELTGEALTLGLAVETYGDSFPAQAGWHPGSAAPSTVRRPSSPSTPPGRRSAARTTCPRAAASTRCPVRGTTASACPTAWT